MNASQMGSKDWWLVVGDMPVVERLEELNAYRNALLQQDRGKRNQHEYDVTIARVNEEIKQVRKLEENATWYRACVDVLPSEWFEAVRIRKISLERR